MQIDTNVRIAELSDDNPTINMLDDREKALYLSALQNSVDAVEDIEENIEFSQEESNSESPKLAEATNQLRAAITLSELIEEVAEERRQDFSKESHNIRSGEQ